MGTVNHRVHKNELSQTAEETQPITNFIAEIYDAVTTTQPEYDAVAKVKTDVPVETTTEAVEETEPQEEPESEPEETEEEVIYSHMLMIPVAGEVAQPFREGDLVQSLPYGLPEKPVLRNIVEVGNLLPFSELGLSWVCPAAVGLVIGVVLHLVCRKKPEAA